MGAGTRTGKALQELLRDAAAYDALRNQAVAALELDATEALAPILPSTMSPRSPTAGPAARWSSARGAASPKRGWRRSGSGSSRWSRAWRGELTPARLADTLERSLREAWWEDLLAREPELRSFRGSSYQTQVQAFRELHSRALQIAREEIVARLAERVPDPHAPGDEMGLLRRQLLLQRRHMPIRQLFAKIPTTLRKLKPCVLMSPLSVAQYLDPSLPGFDVVVFDEASQIPPGRRRRDRARSAGDRGRRQPAAPAHELLLLGQRRRGDSARRGGRPGDREHPRRDDRRPAA